MSTPPALFFRMLTLAAAALLATCAVTTPAVESAPEPEAITAPIPARLEIPRRARVADPWFTRASVRMIGARSNTSAVMPFGNFSGTTDGGGIAIDLYGRRLGFDLALSGGADAQSKNAQTSQTQSQQHAMAGEATLGMTAALWNSHGVSVGAGPGLEARASVGAGDSIASWQTVVAGADIRARVFVGPHLFLTANGFYGAAPIAGSWQSIDSTNGVVTGSLSKTHVMAGAVSASLRPVEWCAIFGGVGIRDAGFVVESKTEAASARERTVRPFAGLELLY